MTSPRSRRALVIGVAALMVAAFALPPLLPKSGLREGRRLARLPEFSGDLSKIRPETEAYVADNFPARRHLIALLNFARLQLAVSGSSKVLIGKQGWLFYNDGSLLGHARGVNRPTEDQARTELTNLQARAEYLQARGAQYLVIAAPTRETIYPQFAPSWFRLDPTRYSAKIAGLANQAVPGRLLHLYPAVANATAAGVLTYSRHDTHWTGDGAYAGYVAVMQALRAQGLREATRPLSDFRPNDSDPRPPRDLALMIGVANLVPIHYRAYEDPAAVTWKTTWLSAGRHDFTKPQVIDTGAVGKPVLLMQRDSFSNALLPFLTGHFSRVILSHIDDGFWRPDLIEQFKPDFVILEVQEAGLGAVLSPAPAPLQPSYPRIEAALQAAKALRPIQAWERPELVSAVAAPGCAVDTLEATPGRLRVVGWISDLRAEAGLGRALVRVSGAGGDFAQEITVDRPRSDLSRAFRRPISDPSGYDVQLSSASAPAGTYDLTIYRASNVGWLKCPGGKVQLG